MPDTAAAAETADARLPAPSRQYSGWSTTGRRTSGASAILRLRCAKRGLNPRARPFEEAARRMCRRHWQKPSRTLRMNRGTRWPFGPTLSEPRHGRASPSCVPTRIQTSCSRPEPPGAARSTTRSRSSQPGRGEPSTEWKVRYALMLGLERVLSEKPPHLASGTELRRHQVDALAGMLTELIAAAQKGENGTATVTTRRRTRTTRSTTSSRSSSRSTHERGRRRARAGRSRPRRDPPLPLPPSDRIRQDDRRIRVRRGCANRRRPDPHPPAPARRPVPPRADRARLRLALPRGGAHGPHRSAAVEPDHDPDLCVVRAARRRDRARRVRARHLRRGAHGARREDLDRDPLSQRADLHRHDRDGGADRQAGLGRVPRLGRRPAARRCRAARPDRAAALPARPAGRSDQPGADRRRRLRGARPRAGPRPRSAEHGRRDALPRAVRRHAGHRLRRRSRPRVQPRDRVPRCGHQGGGGLGPDAAGQARRDPGGLRTRRRSTC